MPSLLGLDTEVFFPYFSDDDLNELLELMESAKQLYGDKRGSCLFSVGVLTY